MYAAESPRYFPHNRQRESSPHFRFRQRSWVEGTRSRSRSHTPDDSRFEQLYRNAVDKKHRLEELAKTDRQRFDRNYKVEPRIRINPNKHDCEVGVAERNELWMQQRKKRLVEIEEEEALRKLKPCTFSPNISSKMNTFYLKEKAKRELMKQQHEINQAHASSKHGGKGKLGYEEAKRSIQHRITTMFI